MTTLRGDQLNVQDIADATEITSTYATIAYTDAIAAGLAVKPAVRAGTTANLVATYNNGTAGVGATLTADANGAWPGVDGITTGWAVLGGVLVKDQTNAAHNGRYYISDLGSAGTPYVLTRCMVCDEAHEIPSSFVFIQEGTVNVGTGYAALVGDPATFVVGTDDIDWTPVSSVGSGLQNVVEDLTPQLGGNLDTNAFDIGPATENVNLTINTAPGGFVGTGDITIQPGSILGEVAAGDVNITGAPSSANGFVAGLVDISGGANSALGGDGNVLIRNADSSAVIQLTGDSSVITATGSITVTGGIDKLTSATTAVDVTSSTPAIGQVLTATSTTAATWQTPAAGGSDNWLTANNGVDFTVAPTATAPRAIAIGDSATANAGYDNVAIGTNADASLFKCIAIGFDTVASSTASIAIGDGSQSIAGAAIAIGDAAAARNSFDIAIGNLTTTGIGAGNSSVAIGNQCNTSATQSIAIGFESDTLLANQIAIGHRCTAASVTSDVPHSVKLGFADGGGIPSGNENFLHLFDNGKLELYGSEAMHIAPTYTLLTLPPLVAGGMIYVSDATNSTALTGSQCYCNGTVWIDVTTGAAVA